VSRHVRAGRGKPPTLIIKKGTREKYRNGASRGSPHRAHSGVVVVDIVLRNWKTRAVGRINPGG